MDGSRRRRYSGRSGGAVSCIANPHRAVANTVKAYAHDLKGRFSFLAERGLDWQAGRLDDVGEFVAWLRLPLQARNGRMAVLRSVQHHSTESTVNCKLSAAGAFFTHAARDGVAARRMETSCRRCARWLETVPGPHQQERADTASGDRVKGAEEAAPCVHAR